MSAVFLNADMPVREIQARTKLKEHQISYSLKKLQEKQLIYRHTMIDVYRLGYVNYGLFFSVNSNNKQVHNELLATMLECPRISFFAELGGDYQYEVTFVAREINEVSDFMDWMSLKFGNIFYQKLITTRMGLYDFENKYLFPRNKKQSSHFWGIAKSKIDIDDLDHNILSAISNYEASSTKEIANLLDVPYTTIDFRLKRLRDRRIIVGSRYFLDFNRAGVQNYILLIYMNGLNAGFREEMYEFCLNHKHIRFLVENLGEWDYEIGVETLDQSVIAEVNRDVLERFGQEVNTVKVLPVFAFHKVVSYPFKRIENEDSYEEAMGLSFSKEFLT